MVAECQVIIVCVCLWGWGADGWKGCVVLEPVPTVGLEAGCLAARLGGVWYVCTYVEKEITPMVLK